MHKTETAVQRKGQQKSSHLGSIISGAFVLLLVGLYFLWPGFQVGVKEAWEVLTSGDRGRISAWVGELGLWGPFLIVLFMVVQMFLVVVNVVVLMLVAIIAYGPVWGTIIAVMAVVVASTFGFVLGRMLGSVSVKRLLGAETTRKVKKEVECYGFWAVFVARISPFFSNDAVSFVAGLAGMPYLRFMAATLLGILPLALLLAWLGEEWERLKTGLIWVSVVSVAAFIAYYLYEKKRKQSRNCR